jgi:hypothetical protein
METSSVDDSLAIQRKSPVVNESTSDKPLPQVATDRLLSSLHCPICSDILVDAVVTPCSHSFCHACIETHHRSRNMETPTCPVCNENTIRVAVRPPLKSHAGTLNTDSDGNIKHSNASSSIAAYFRCSYLDSIIMLLLDNSGEVALEVFISKINFVFYGFV